MFISGQVAQDADGNTVGKGDVEKQTEGVLQNIRSLIEVAGSGLADIARLAIFITEREHIEPVMAVRRRVLTPPYPATTAVIVAGLVNPEGLVEIEATAVLP